MTKHTISIIVPCYNEEPTIALFYPAVQEVFADMADNYPDYEPEYWFVNDGSTDDSIGEMRKLQSTDPEHVHYIDFSRNFGKESALYAGLQHATGELVAVMDVDLQDPPALLTQMLDGVTKEGYDIVGARRVDRNGEPPIRSFFSKMFYRLINRISQTHIVPGARDYRLMTRQVVNAILSMAEVNRFSKGIFSWVGFKTTYIDFENRDRVAGDTSWSFFQLFSYSLEGIIDFSDAPLSIASFTGFISFFAALIALIFIVIRALVFGDHTTGWPSMVSIVLLMGGLQLFCLGILGKYIGRLYLESKHRPIYIVKDEK
ncbi:glycosyltransferase family 2 protein [Furfurilactobacillus siliginis]|uniref:Glucosyl transferase family 2 n=1 Tax=Furfurilactobacillus siliginis TaxID=348151 RepID=A0A0R2L009_9LACO|nr:glycosyltransferase family 2 protein [Furfurilactobacillus siliginis]KRN95099.1 glycosyl transferase 2 family protein [Furfurilactobacillus siliginis]GEK28356.1 glucosyl transferase family 2 [Furfurilactobacillus siliginis]